VRDEELVERARNGRSEAFAELVRRWAGRVVALCCARADSSHAEDLAQETLLRAWKNLSELREPAKFGSWLLGTSVRLCLDWRRAKARTEKPLSSVEREGAAAQWIDPAAPDPAEYADESPAERLRAEISKLPEECREALHLYYGEPTTYEEIAALLGVSAATVNARLTKARKMLRQAMAEAGGSS
jgi:RNA polymerase sigma-70 factor (ECF subfamily)